MVHNEKFKIEAVMKGDHRTVMMRGIIDEDTNFDAILKTKGPLVVNFKGVTAINSCGVRNWVNLLKAMGTREVSYEDCPPLIVRQMNMVPSFVGKATVLSVYAAYVCDNCETEKLISVVRQYFKNTADLQEPRPCETCKKGEMEFDGHPQQYFAFAK